MALYSVAVWKDSSILTRNPASLSLEVSLHPFFFNYFCFLVFFFFVYFFLLTMLFLVTIIFLSSTPSICASTHSLMQVNPFDNVLTKIILV